MNDRVLALEGVHNFRDYGGYAVAGGGRLKRGLLWRSAQHHGATDADLAAIDALGLGTVIDFRGAKERAAFPCRRGPGFSAEVIVPDGETTGLAPHLAAAKGALDGAGADRALLAAYAGIPAREKVVAMLRRYFAALAATDRPSLVHCVAGKDRTGFAVALFHLALGVDRADVLDDYELTNTAGNPERRLAEGGAMLRARYGTADEATLRTLLGVRRGYLETALAAVDAHPGGLDGYLEQVIGVSAMKRAALRATYVEHVTGTRALRP